MKFVILLAVICLAQNGISLECYEELDPTKCEKFDKEKGKKVACNHKDFECGFASSTKDDKKICQRGCMPKKTCTLVETAKTKDLTCYTCDKELCNDNNSAYSNHVSLLLLLPVAAILYMFN